MIVQNENKLGFNKTNLNKVTLIRMTLTKVAFIEDTHITLTDSVLAKS